MNIVARAGSLLLLGVWFGSLNLSGQTPVVIQTNVTVRVMASNLSSGNNQRYESAGLDILKGLKPDVVAMQEFNYAARTGKVSILPPLCGR